MKKIIHLFLLLSVILICPSCKKAAVRTYYFSEDTYIYYEQISTEDYQGMSQPFAIKFVNGNHYYYNLKEEPYIVGDCVLYAVVRALRHLGQNGNIDPDLWKRYTILELRNLLADIVAIRDPDRADIIRKPQEWLDATDARIILTYLIGPSHTLIDIVCNDNESLRQYFKLQNEHDKKKPYRWDWARKWTQEYGKILPHKNVICHETFT
jgi:hypothetical protein